MCGITGWAYEDPRRIPGDSESILLSRMCDRIAHRGPDDEGYWLGGGAALGMRRLSVIDLETGQQPVWNTSKTVVAVMNGEIYNFLEIREELEKKGHSFISSSDTEVLPHLYDEYGDDLVDHLDGMFAFALWDLEKKRLLICRDRFGEKPLYYGRFGDSLIFGSELKAVLSHPYVGREMDSDALYLYLSFDYVPAPFSIFSGIKKLPAAHRLVWESGGISIDRYWDLSFAKPKQRPSVPSSAAELREILARSVKRRLIADVPLGVLLSGGIDSSTVAALAVREAGERVKTFSIGFEEDSFDESVHARNVACFLGTEHFEETLSVDTAAELIPDVGRWLDEPLSDGSLFPTLLLSAFVRKHVTVALGGDGGDELFAGYPMYIGHKASKLYRAIPETIRSGLVRPLIESLPSRTGNLSFDYKAKRFARAADKSDSARHHGWFGSFDPASKDELLTPAFRARIAGEDTYAIADALLAECDSADGIERMQYLDINLYLAEDILTKVDRASMSVSLEVRAPFLDHKLAEFTASLPPSYKLKRRKSKYILKKAVEGLLPAEIISRPKKGFGMPVAKWLNSSLRELLHDLLSPERLRREGVFEPLFVEKLIREHEQGRSNNYKELWTLLMFELWSENFLS